MRFVALHTFTVAFTLSVFARAAEPDKEACVAAYSSSQRLAHDGKLHQAKGALLVCARDPCPAVLQRDCAVWLTEIDKRMPTVVVSARATDGTPVVDAQVRFDDEPAVNNLDGRAVEVDPGEHAARLLRRGMPEISMRWVAHEGEKSQRLEFVVPSAEAVKPLAVPARAPAEAAPTARRAAPVWPIYLSFGVAAAATGSFSYFALSGDAQQRNTLDACRGHCAQGDVDDVHRNYLFADISLAVGLVALGAATYLLVTRSSATER
jgi:hypothetical protein